MSQDVFSRESSISTKFDLYQDVTNRIIALIENGITPWRKPWNSYGLARNYVSGRVYTGINYILMNNTSHVIPYFLTLKQIQDLGCSLKEGAKSEKVIYFNTRYKDRDNHYIDDDVAIKLIREGQILKYSRYIKYYKVFGVKDIDGLELEIPDSIYFPNEKIEICENILNNMPLKPEILSSFVDEAFYSPSQDIINMPNLDCFNSSEHYYATLFHELVHSTGHVSRLNRIEVNTPTGFGTALYSKEEIVAEMGASFLCAKAQINYDELVLNNAAYLKNWLDHMKEDSKFIFVAAAESQKAVDYILGTK